MDTIMEVLWLIIILVWLATGCFAYRVGYKKGLNAKKLVIESLSFKQAMKWWAVHELIRHEDDKRSIRKDLKKLHDVKMPEGVDFQSWVDIT